MATEYPFRWKTRQVANPYTPRMLRLRLTKYILVCNSCNDEVIAGAPGNHVGERYFNYYAKEAATKHLETCGKVAA